MRYLDLPEPALQPGGLVVRMRAIGLNFADIYRRRGNYPLAGQPPHVLGYEGAGVVDGMFSAGADGDGDAGGGGVWAKAVAAPTARSAGIATADSSLDFM